jgi:Ser/Thr protein kinase RdoA (MazF antagonist)
LFPVIPGRHAPAPTSVETQVAGTALGNLDAALGNAPDGLLTQPFPQYGDLDHIHSLVSDSRAVVDDIDLDAEQRRAYRHFLDTARAAIPGLYDQLPRQLIHSDYARSNVLMEGDRVSGILYFEFAARDLRAMEFAVGLYQYGCTKHGRVMVQWDLLRAFSAGYGARVSLAPAEVQAVPALLRLRRTVSGLHFIGRWRQGLATASTIAEQARDTLVLHHWLLDHERELVAYLQSSLL